MHIITCEQTKTVNQALSQYPQYDPQLGILTVSYLHGIIGLGVLAGLHGI
jgi:energy-converting hydrogenase Eha subunit F